MRVGGECTIVHNIGPLMWRICARPIGWSFIVITINVLAIWAVTVHGKEMKDLEALTVAYAGTGSGARRSSWPRSGMTHHHRAGLGHPNRMSRSVVAGGNVENRPVPHWSSRERM